MGFFVYEKWIYGFFCFSLIEDLFGRKSLWAEMDSAPTDFLLFFVENENDQKIKMMINGLVDVFLKI